MKKLIVASIFCLVLNGAQTLVQNSGIGTNCSAATTTHCDTNTLTATGAGHLGVYVGWANGSGITWSSVADTAGSTWVIGCTANTTIATSVVVAYSTSLLSGATKVTATVSSSGAGRAAAFYEVSNGLSWAIDNTCQALGDNSAGTTLPGVALTIGGSNDFLVQAINAVGGAATAINGSYTLDVGAGGNRNFAHRLNTTAGAAPNWTLSPAGTGNVLGIAFKDVSSGGTTVVKHKVTNSSNLLWPLEKMIMEAAGL